MRFIHAALLCLPLLALTVQAQVPNDVATRNAILDRLPEGVTAETATADQLAQSVLELALKVNSEGEETKLTQAEMEANLTRIMYTLGEMTRNGEFKNAPRFGDKNPPGRLYTRVLNVASSNLDVASETYYGTTTQFIIGLTAAMREGQNLLNGAQSNAITRK